ncbi:MAG: gamma-mobile-trio protein GmtX [Sulfuricaulis sp.]|nr:gamma-mobile-trio protein GmtX [Sulfuricaulis sp.]
MNTTPNKPTPDKILEELKAKLGVRAHPNLDNVHEVCRAISNEPGDPTRKDYSLATVGRRLARQQKSPSYNTLQSPAGAHFKALIRAWAECAGASMVKHTATRTSTPDDQLLQKISDPALRSELGFRLAEGRRLAGEISLLKGQTTLAIDMRPKDGLAHAQGGRPLEIVESAVALLDSERSSLTQALDESYLHRVGITLGEEGELQLHGKLLFGFGFASGLRKLLQLPK